MKRILRTALYVASGLAALYIYTMIALVFFSRSGSEISYTSKQPDNIQYDSRGPYMLEVVKGPRLWATISGEHYLSEIWVTSGGAGYGHSVTFNVPQGVSISQTDWRKDGIEVTLASKHKLFIPKDCFIGGR